MVGWVDIKDNHPPDDPFVNAYWVWNGKYVVLARWVNGLWDTRGFFLNSEDVTHYCKLIRPEPPE